MLCAVPCHMCCLSLSAASYVCCVCCVQLGEAAGVTVGEVGLGACREGRRPGCGGGCVLRAGLSGQFALVDANTSAVVGPRLALHATCSCGGVHAPHPTTCTTGTCLNGGRCVHTSTGARWVSVCWGRRRRDPSQQHLPLIPLPPRCVCPHHAHGSRCKVLTRHFKGGTNEHGWAWTPPVPACADMHLSVEVLTRAGDATLLYAGPDTPPHAHAHTHNHNAARDVVALEVRGGRPSLLLDLGGGPVTLTVNTTTTITDNTWHRLDVLWRKQVSGQVCPSPVPLPPHPHPAHCEHMTSQAPRPPYGF